MVGLTYLKSLIKANLSFGYKQLHYSGSDVTNQTQKGFNTLMHAKIHRHTSFTCTYSLQLHRKNPHG